MPADGQVRDTVWVGDGDPSYLLRPSLDSERFFDELAKGRFVLRFCTTCGRPRYPHAPVCPYCGGLGFSWQPAATSGTVLTWARCHTAFVPEFAPLLPYVVVDVEMAAGVRVIGRLVGSEAEPHCGMAVEVVAERWPAGRAVPAFVLAEDAGSEP